jgi:hypothetical protein
MPRLPLPGQDAGEWGTILNDFLSSSLSSDGTLKPNTVGSSQLQAGSVTAAKVAADVATQVELDAVAATKLTIPTGTQSTGLVPVATSGSATAWTDLGGVYGPLVTVRRVSTSTTAAVGEVVVVDTTGGSRTVTLPAAAVKSQTSIKKIDSSGNAVVVVPDASATIDGLTSVAIVGQFESVTFLRESSNSWVRI